MLIEATALTLDDETLAKRGIKKVPGTTLRAYTLLHEGTSTPRHGVTREPLRLRWSKAIVRAVGGMVRAGLQFFRGHQPPGTPNRQAVGEVVGSWVQQLGDRLAAVVVGRFAGDVSDLDTCSIEADVEWEGDTVVDVSSINGVALGNSRSSTPAFPGARALASVQCFGEEGEQEETVGPKEIREWLQQNPGYHISNLVDEDRVMGDPGFHGIGKLRKDLQERDGDLAASRKQVTRLTGEGVLRQKLTAGKYSEQARAYIGEAWAAHAEPSDKAEVVDQFIKTTAERFTNLFKMPATVAGEKADDGATMANGQTPAANQEAQAQAQKASAAKGGAQTAEDLMKSVGIIKESKAA